jgi:NAD kinase
VQPTVDAMIITPIAPHHADEPADCDFRAVPRFGCNRPWTHATKCVFTLDGQSTFLFTMGDVNSASRAQRSRCGSFVPPRRSYFEVLRTKLKWV